MKIRIFLTILLITPFFACRDVYRDYAEISNMTWHKNDIKSFKPVIETSGFYDIYLTSRHITGFRDSVLRVSVNIEKPNGASEKKSAVLQIMDKNKEYTGEVAGNLWDTEVCFSQHIELSSGTYQISVAHDMPGDPVILLKDIGIKIKKTE